MQSKITDFWSITSKSDKSNQDSPKSKCSDINDKDPVLMINELASSSKIIQSSKKDHSGDTIDKTESDKKKLLKSDKDDMNELDVDDTNESDKDDMNELDEDDMFDSDEENMNELDEDDMNESDEDEVNDLIEEKMVDTIEEKIVDSIEEKIIDSIEEKIVNSIEEKMVDSSIVNNTEIISSDIMSCKLLCLKINDVVVSRRLDNNRINVSKLLIAANINKNHRGRILAKIGWVFAVKKGPMKLQGSYCSIPHCKEELDKLNISHMFYPLLEDKIPERFLKVSQSSDRIQQNEKQNLTHIDLQSQNDGLERIKSETSPESRSKRRKRSND